MKFKLPNSISSPQDVSSLILEIHDYSKWFAHESTKMHVAVKHKSEAPIISDEASQIIQEWGGNKPLNQDILNSIINELNNYFKTASVINITLASPVNLSIKKTIVDWCRNNINENILVNFGFNSTLLGGMVVRYKSRIFDWSFRRQILDSRNKFTEVLNRV